nr:MAG TPA: hypothetical protein [Caudoviricetes sp.]
MLPTPNGKELRYNHNILQVNCTTAPCKCQGVI